MEGSVSYEPRPLRTPRHVLRAYELPFDLPDHDERHLSGPHHGGRRLRLPRRYPHLREVDGRTASSDSPRPRTPSQTQTFPSTRGVRVREDFDRVSRTDHLRGRNAYGSCQGRRRNRMAHTHHSKGGAIVPRIRELLPKVHRRFLAPRETPLRAHEEGSKVELGRERAIGVRRDQNSDHLLPYPSLRRRLEVLSNRSRQFGLRNGLGPLATVVRRSQMAPYRLLLEITQRRRAKLRDPR